ncbi:MAG: HEAT repeat domain-containing protein [Gemmataceae bacterium]|nr:HEAT repeat domain-containing protein [Gemmataceae bacterium]
MAEPNVSISDRARTALGPDGPFLKIAVPALIEALGDKEAREDRIIVILADHGEHAVPGLLAALRRPDALTRSRVTEALAAIRPRSADVNAALIRSLDDAAPEVRTAAAKGLGKIRHYSSTVVPKLLARVGDSDPYSRAEIVTALGRLARTPGPALTAVVDALKDQNEFVRAAAAQALASVSPPLAKVIAPDVINNLKIAREEYIRQDLARILAKAGLAAAPAVPQLTEMLKSKDTISVGAAAWALGAIGQEAKSAIPRLLDLAKNKDHEARLAAFAALGRIGPAAKEVIPLCTDLLRADAQNYERAIAADTLGGIGPDARSVVPTLVAIALDRKNSGSLRESAAKAVARIDPATAKTEKLEFAHLDIRLGEVSKVVLRPRPKMTAEQSAKIKSLIASLAETNVADVGLSASMNGTAFAPFPDRARFQSGLLTAERRGPSDAFRKLVELGPDALPFLLSSLDDSTPTRIKIQRSPGDFFSVGGSMPEGNPFNSAETKALGLKFAFEDEDDDNVGGYTIKVGDVCFVAIGQIVNRPYAAVQYIPTAIVSINAVSQSHVVRERLRAAWGGPDPAKGLLTSLLTDYATEGVFNGSSLDGWDEGSRYQIEAAVRLLYYFPDDAGPVIATRLKGLDVAAPGGGDKWMLRDVRNRIRTIEFIKAVSWVNAGPVRDALADVARRTDDPAIRRAVAQNK